MTRAYSGGISVASVACPRGRKLVSAVWKEMVEPGFFHDDPTLGG